MAYTPKELADILDTLPLEGYNFIAEAAQILRNLDAVEDLIDTSIYDAFHNMAQDSMSGKINTQGDMKDYVTKIVLDNARQLLNATPKEQS